MRHLTEEQALQALARGAGIEQMISRDLADGEVCWLGLRSQRQTFVITLHRVVDQGSDDFLDVYEFQPADEAEEPGEGMVLAYRDEASAALAVAVAHGAERNLWVNAGVIQDEYGDLRTA